MSYQLNKAVVIGSGTMGAAIAAHLANAGVRVTLLDIVPKDAPPGNSAARNAIVKKGLEAAIKSRPASFVSSEHADMVTIGNTEDDLGVVTSADWVIEVIIENLKIKQDLMEKLDALRGPKTIISTNTSGIPIAAISEGRSEGFRQHFLGTHFFNPPRYLKLLEIIPGQDTLPEVLTFISKTGEKRLGKGIVLCKDTPNFIANRLGSAGGAFAMHYILENGYTVKEVDTITGPAMGRPKTGTFRLLDLVGVDVWDHVGSNLAKAIPHDQHALPYLQSEKANTILRTMVEKKMLGNKTNQGFYKTVRGKDGEKEFWELDLNTLEYAPSGKVRFDSIGKALGSEKLADRLKIMIAAEDRAGDLVRALTFQGLAYASHMIPEIADTPKPMDDAMRWGFAHDAGPFEVWDLLGVAETAQQMREAGYAPAPWVEEMLAKGYATFYRGENGTRAVYHPGKGAYISLAPDTAHIVLKTQKEMGKLIAKNASASLVDLGDGVACVEFHTKMNVLDTDIGLLVDQALTRVETDFEGLVIGNDAENFSAGANLFVVVMNAQAGQWEAIDQMVRGLQDLHMRMRYFHKPVVVAPAGLALGGGAEMIMHASRVVSHVELYTGLVELGVGVIPAGGGTKEMMRRIVNPAMRTPNVLVLPFVQRLLEQIGTAKVATSAEEARQFGILGATDRVIFYRDHLLAEAKREVLAMAAAGYVPPRPEKIYAGGRDLYAATQVALKAYVEAKQISAYDFKVAGKLAYILSGGELSRPTWVSEQYILDLEREAFLSLCGEEKTQQRMWHTLNTGKPLRN
ncbi:MAG: enoyl-CoA hydratase/isomerase family protein [Anaerolineales bacterium]|nr:enoyl-CoA hydratase/isomerase family protein [Anaerolineales bacterium]